MEIRKIETISPLMILFLMSMAGCTTTYLDMKSWEGRTINDLYFEKKQRVKTYISHLIPNESRELAI